MTQETDSIKTDIAPQGKKPRRSDDFMTLASSDENAPSALLTLKRYLVMIARKLYDAIGELFSIICVLTCVWFYGVASLLTQQSVDISRFRPDAERWFSQAFNGNNAHIDNMSLRWLPASDSVVLDLKNIAVRDKNDRLIQNYTRLSTAFPLKTVIAARPVPNEVNIHGGSLSWVEDASGRIIAGLGNPENVGRLGPVFRGEFKNPSQNNANVEALLEDFKVLNVRQAELHYVSKSRDVDVVADLENLSLKQIDERLDFLLSGSVRQDDSAAPLRIELNVDKTFSDYDGFVSSQGLRPDIIAPKKGRFKVFSGLAAPVNIAVNAQFSQEKGLQSSKVSLDVGRGNFQLRDKTYPFDRANYSARLEPGQQRMKVERLALSSDLLTFDGVGELTELGALNDGDINSSPVFDIRLNDVVIDAQPVMPGPTVLKEVKAAGYIDFDARQLSLPEIILQMDDNYGFNLAVDSRQKTDGSGLETLTLSGALTGEMSPRELLALWPPLAADGARRWVDGAVKGARIDRFKFKANLDSAYFDNPIFSEKYITAELDLREGRVKYMRAMPPLENVIAHGRLIGNRIEADVISATVGDLNIEKGRVEMPRLLPIGGDIIIDMTGTGEAAEMLRLIDNEPFQFATNYGVDPNKFGGNGRIDMRITRPMLVHFDQSRIQYSVKGNFSQASTPFEILGQTITDGNIYLEADKTGMAMSGPVKIGPWPVDMQWQEYFGENPPPTQYTIKGDVGQDTLDTLGLGLRQFFDGTIGVILDGKGRGLDVSSANLTADLTRAEVSILNVWNKDVGQGGTLKASLERGAEGSIILPQLDFKAPGLEIFGAVEVEQNFQLKVLDFSKMRIDGLVDAAVQLKPDAQNRQFSLFVEGDYLDISPWTNATLNTRRSSAIDVPVILTASMNNLILKEDYVLSDAKFLFTHSGTSLSNLRLGGGTGDGQLTAELVTNPVDGTRLVTIEIPDASKAVSAFLGLDSTEGGKLDINAKLAPIDTDGRLVGRAEITDFKLRRAPFMAQILSLASLTGLVDTLGGDGLAFERFDVPFTLSDDLLQIREARLYGPALGMTGGGDINLDTRILDFDGTVVPAYNANTVLGDIPVLGSLIGRKGEGVFALNYDVRGPFEKVQISVNPLSALTPGFLRGIFRPKRDKLPDEVMEQIEAVRPKDEEEP